MATPFPPKTPNPMIPDLVRFYRNDADRIRAVVMEVEAANQNPGGGRPQGRRNDGPWFIYGYAANGASGASGATLGSGSFMFCTRSGATLAAVNGASFTFYNAGGPINSAFYGEFGFCNGAWSVVVAPCTS